MVSSRVFVRCEKLKVMQKLIAENRPNSLLFHAMVGLNKLLEANQLNNFKYSSSGLMGCSIEGVDRINCCK